MNNLLYTNGEIIELAVLLTIILQYGYGGRGGCSSLHILISGADLNREAEVTFKTGVIYYSNVCTDLFTISCEGQAGGNRGEGEVGAICREREKN